jgi:N-acetylmuramic acid 6-phosphate etherase
MLTVINDADRRALAAVAAVLDEIAATVDPAVAELRGGRRVHYFGAGTSGRLGVSRAAELAPTFNRRGTGSRALAGGLTRCGGPPRTPRTTTGPAPRRPSSAYARRCRGRLAASGRTLYAWALAASRQGRDGAGMRQPEARPR